MRRNAKGQFVSGRGKTAAKKGRGRGKRVSFTTASGRRVSFATKR